MKRVVLCAIYLVGALSIAYLALHLYAMLAAPGMTPGRPIEIYRDLDAPEYSALAADRSDLWGGAVDAAAAIA